MKRTIVLAFLTMFLCDNGAVLAEGFPGVGDRAYYAEALPHYNLGNRYLAKEWYEKAVEKYNDAINLYPYDADVYINLGIAYRKLNNMEGAEAAWRKSVELNSKDWTTWSNLGNLLAVEARFPEAYECFQKALKAKPPDEERKAIEANIDGMKKIMKARGLTVEGKPLVSEAVPTGAAKKNTKSVANGKGKKNAVSLSSKTSTNSGKVAVPNSGGTGGGANSKTHTSELDSEAYDKWLGN